MKRMSRMATNEYIGAKRRLYATADREKRIKMLDEVCETTGYERKYANRLLTGSRKFRERKGRGKTYGEDVGAVHSAHRHFAGDAEKPVFPVGVRADLHAGHHEGEIPSSRVQQMGGQLVYTGVVWCPVTVVRWRRFSETMKGGMKTL
jgi:hypothetical protein